MTVVVHWNGKDVPPELEQLPEGRYVIEAVDGVPELTEDEERGLLAGLASIREGRVVEADDARKRLIGRLKK